MTTDMFKLPAAPGRRIIAAPGDGCRPGRSPDADPRVQKIVATVSQERLQQLLARLVELRHPRDAVEPGRTTRAIGGARQWIFDEMKRSSPRLQVSFDTHQIAPQGRITRQVELRNVMAVLPGKSPRRIYVSGHYDSLNLGDRGQAGLNTGAGGNPQATAEFNHDVEAPGANDDGSGTVLTMELARVFAESGVEFDATLVFICWAGEEQGLIGSRRHAQDLVAEQGRGRSHVQQRHCRQQPRRQRRGRCRERSCLCGRSRGFDGAVTCAIHCPHRRRAYVPSHQIRLMAREDRFGRGSDQSSFTQAGFPAIVFREPNENFSKQHSARDTIDGVDFAYLAQNARVNAAGVASLGLAPPAPKVTGERGQNLSGRGTSGYDADMRWAASPGAVAYRVYWRETWSNDWQRQQTIGNVTQFVLPNVSIDDFVFGVAAIGADGHESLVSAYVSPVRRSAEVKVVK